MRDSLGRSSSTHGSSMPIVRLLVPAALLFPTAVNGQATWRIDTIPILTIPAVSDAGEVNFGTAVGATRLANGDVVIADGTVGAIVRFSPAGAMRGRSGGEGAGPGEFRTLWWMGQCGVDSLWAHDLNEPRLSLFAGEGTFLRQVLPPSPAGLVRCGATGQLALLTIGPPPSSGGTTVRPPADLYAMKPTLEFVKLRTGVPATEFAMVGSMPVPFPLGRTTVVAVRGTETILGVADSAVLERIGPQGQSLGLIRLPATARAPTAREAADAADALLTRVPTAAREYLAPLLEQIPPPPQLPPYFGLWVDSGGRLWVQRSPPGAPVRFTVVSPTGAPLAEASAPITFTPLEVDVDGILALVERQDGELAVALLPVHQK